MKRWRNLLTVALATALLVAMSGAQAGRVTSVRIHKSPEYTRVVFDVSEHVTFTVATLTHPDRVVVDIAHTQLAPGANIEPASAASAPLTALRHVHDGGDLRWIFDLAAPVRPKTFVLDPAAPYGHRLVVDLYGQPALTADVPRNTVVAARPSGAGAPVSVSVSSARTPSGASARPGPPDRTEAVLRPPVARDGAPAAAPNGPLAGVPAASSASAPAGLSGAAAATSAAPPPTTAGTSVTSATAAPDVPPTARQQSAATATQPPVAAQGRVSTPTNNSVVAPLSVPASAPARPAPAARAVPRGQEVVIAIDAGHGGEDPGAIGSDGVQEKDVVLAIARRLAELVSAEPGFRAVLIRDGDYYIPLGLRPRKARDAGAHFFVSVHADAHSNRAARGASVYALSERGATSETAKWLAQRENSSDLVGGVSLDDKDRLLAEVLLDLSMTASLAESLEMGSHVLGNLRDVTKLHSRHVEQAGFRVLKSPDIPSILVETGYVSNAADARQLGSAAYRTEIASAIFAGVRAQAIARPPRGTVFALRAREQQLFARARAGSTAGATKTPSATALSVAAAGPTAPQSDREHKVAEGETLSAVAARFGVSRSAIRRLNGLVGDGVRIGQVLRIPEQAAIAQ